MAYSLPVDYTQLTQSQRREVREQYTHVQGGNCAHCGTPLWGEPAKEIMGKRLKMRLFPPNFLLHPVHLHHSHDTGMTIGAVHARCNAVLWQYHGE